MAQVDPEDIHHGDSGLRRENHNKQVQHRRRRAREQLAWVAEWRQEQVRQIGHAGPAIRRRQYGNLDQRLAGLDQAVGADQPLQACLWTDTGKVYPQRMRTQQEARLHQDNRHAGQHCRQHEWRRSAAPGHPRQTEYTAVTGGEFHELVRGIR